MQQGVAVLRARGEGWIGLHSGIKAGVEGGAELVHRCEHIAVALHPAEVVGPGGAIHGEPVIERLELGDCCLHGR